MHLLKSYAWLLGDVALLLWVVYELISLRPRREKRSDDDDRPS